VYDPITQFKIPDYYQLEVPYVPIGHIPPPPEPVPREPMTPEDIYAQWSQEYYLEHGKHKVYDDLYEHGTDVLIEVAPVFIQRNFFAYFPHAFACHLQWIDKWKVVHNAREWIQCEYFRMYPEKLKPYLLKTYADGTLGQESEYIQMVFSFNYPHHYDDVVGDTLVRPHIDCVDVLRPVVLEGPKVLDPDFTKRVRYQAKPQGYVGINGPIGTYEHIKCFVRDPALLAKYHAKMREYVNHRRMPFVNEESTFEQMVYERAMRVRGMAAEAFRQSDFDEIPNDGKPKKKAKTVKKDFRKDQRAARKQAEMLRELLRKEKALTRVDAEPQSGLILGTVSALLGVVGTISTKHAITLKSQNKVTIGFDHHVRMAFGKGAAIIGAFLAIYIARRWPSPFTNVCAIGASVTAAMVLVPDELKAHVSGLIARHWGSNSIEAQADFDDDFLIKGIMLGATVTTSDSKNVAGIYKSLLRSAPNFERSASGFKSMGAWVIDAFERVTNKVVTLFGGQAMHRRRTGIQEIDAWCDQVAIMENRFQRCKDSINVANIGALNHIKDEGCRLQAAFRRDPLERQLIQLNMQRINAVITANAGAFAAVRGFRAEPVAMIIGGKPGIGKSILQGILSRVIAGLLTTTEELNGESIDTQIWSMEETEFANGYAGQLVAVFDDLGQRNAAQSDDTSHFFKLIKYINTWACPLNFADLHNKGKNYFTSRAIFATTNTLALDKDVRAQINHPEALTRRFKFQIHVDLRDEWKNGDGHLDWNKYVKYTDEFDAPPYHAWIFRRYNMLTGAVVPGELDIEELMVEFKNSLTASSAALTRLNKLNVSDFSSLRRNQVAPQSALDDLKRDEPSTSYTELEQELNPALKQRTRVVFEDGYSDFQVKNEVGTDVMDEVNCTEQLKANKPVVQINGQDVTMEQFSKWNLDRKRRTCDILRRRMLARFQSYYDWILGLPWVKITTYAMLAGGALLLFKATIHGMIVTLFGKGPKATRREKRACRKLKAKKPVDVDDGDKSGSDSDSESEDSDSDEVAVASVPSKKKIEAQLGDGATLNIKMQVQSVLFSIDLFKDGKLHKHVGNGMHVRHKYVMLNTHFCDGFRRNLSCYEGMEVRFTCAARPNFCFTKSVADMSNPKNYIRVTDDCSVIASPHPAMKDMVRFFVTSADVEAYEASEVTLYGYSTTASLASHTGTGSKRLVVNVGSETADSYVLRTAIEYEIPTVNGDCGAILGVETTRFGNRRLIGMHSAGDVKAKVGYSTIVTQEKLLEAFKRLNVIECLDPLEAVSQTGQIFPGENCLSMTIGSVKGTSSSPETNIRVSELKDAWGEDTRLPAVLAPLRKDGVWVEPLRNAIEKYLTPVHVINPELIVPGVKTAMHAFRQLTTDDRKYSRRILTFEEAVAGIPGEEFINGLARKTSCGYPDNAKGIGNKSYYFGASGDYDFEGVNVPDLRRRTMKIISDASKGKRGFHVFTDTLKDELRKLAKVKNADTRLIAAAPLDYVIAVRMYFLSFVSATAHTRIRNRIALGINPFCEWGMLARKLHATSSKVFAGDFKNFDCSQQADVYDAMCDEINDWYDDGEENALIRRVLIQDLSNSRHLGGPRLKKQIIYQWYKSMPSGHPLTTVVNSFYSVFALAVCWKKLCGDWESFHTHFYCCTYGDDNINAVADGYTSLFNQNTVAPVMQRELGMVYTDEAKTDGVIPDFRTIFEVTFLKRGFRYEDEIGKMWVAPLDLGSVLYKCYWYKTSTTDKHLLHQIMMGNITSTLRELSLHPQEVWDHWVGKIAPPFKAFTRDRPMFGFEREPNFESAIAYVPPYKH
jgi:hypothetical protein